MIAEAFDKQLTATPHPVLSIAVPYPLRQCFDYYCPDGVAAGKLRPGVRIEVPFGKRTTIGYLLAVGERQCDDGIAIKTAIAVLDEEPLLTEEALATLHWASRYYHHPLGEVLAAAFPVILRQGQAAETNRRRILCLTPAGRAAPAQGRAARQIQLLKLLQARGNGYATEELKTLDFAWQPPAKGLIEKGWAVFEEEALAAPLWQPTNAPHHPYPLNPAQRYAVESVAAKFDTFQPFLLEGVTGSGKTEVYLRLVEQALARGGQTLILVPEINLTPQLEARFRSRLPAPMAVFHSGLNENARCKAWLSLQRGESRILLGTRSAVFTPLAQPGLIVLDEEHDASFKQQDGFRFSARDVAILRARHLGIPILLGSATPSLESLANVLRGRFAPLSLPDRTGSSVHPSYQIVDIRNQRLNEGLSPLLIAEIAANLAKGEQTLLFLNRRGFAPRLICHACGWVAECRRCDARLVVHVGERRLSCHHCGEDQALLRDCPQCHTADLRPLGQGTERVELALEKLFPHAKTVRIDRDSTRRKGSLEGMLAQVQAGEVDILLGTQMLAKGHHFPGVTLVGILDVDGGLFSLDFRAGERIAQTIVQVAGRAGREDRPGRVLLQTRQPAHPLLRKLIREGYSVFAAAALLERRELGLPPFSHQALWRAESNDAEAPALFLSKLAELNTGFTEVLTLGPVAAPKLRLSGQYRQQLLLQCRERKPLHTSVDALLNHVPKLPETKKVRWSIDIDPVDLY